MSPLLRRRRFFTSAVFLTTAASIILISIFAAAIGIYAPEAAEAIGLFPFFILNLGVLIVGFAAQVLHSRSVEQSIINPLQRISDVTQAIVEGAISGRIELSDEALPDVIRVANTINRLAQKATRDIEEMKRLERVRSEFVGNVSHELRTPIFSVQGYLETLLDGAIDDHEVSRQFLEKAYQNALRLNALLSDLIDISRIESGELRLSFRFFDIGDLLKELVHNMEIRGLQRDVSLNLELGPDTDLSVYGDKERLTQVITNLIDNAIKYNREGGTVTISTEKQKGRVIVSVRDTGIGISPEHQARIFERFYRVDKDRSRTVGGTGLGLAIVKHILEAHNSPITVESVPGVGTVIAFSLKTS